MQGGGEDDNSESASPSHYYPSPFLSLWVDQSTSALGGSWFARLEGIHGLSLGVLLSFYDSLSFPLPVSACSSLTFHTQRQRSSDIASGHLLLVSHSRGSVYCY